MNFFHFVWYWHGSSCHAKILNTIHIQVHHFCFSATLMMEFLLIPHFVVSVVQVAREQTWCLVFFFIYIIMVYGFYTKRNTQIINKKQFNLRRLSFRIYALQKLLYFVGLQRILVKKSRGQHISISQNNILAKLFPNANQSLLICCQHDKCS